ncbi:MAG: DUF5343 domain-containing protein [Dehalococcoidia bacterium]|nr:DUF5343 domain-containing protein [Dehalococcoidia bacterium]
MQTGDRSSPPPPYGPTQGTIEALQLLQKQSPARVDESFLRAQRIAPRNEYKVVGALRFLGLIGDDGRPTEKAHLLKTRGGAFTLNLQDIVRDAYADLFKEIRPRDATREAIYNHFVTRVRLGGEMAIKATRFFQSLCRWAGIAVPEEAPVRRGAAGGVGRLAAPERARAPRVSRKNAVATAPAAAASVEGLGLPFMLAITPETARLGEDELVDLFRKIRRAAQQSAL